MKFIKLLDHGGDDVLVAADHIICVEWGGNVCAVRLCLTSGKEIFLSEDMDTVMGKLGIP